MNSRADVKSGSAGSLVMVTRVSNNTIDAHYLHKPGFFVVPHNPSSLECSTKGGGTELKEVLAAGEDPAAPEQFGNKIPPMILVEEGSSIKV